VVKQPPSRPKNMSNLFSDIIDEMEKLLVKAKKVENGSTLEEAGVEGAWLTAYAQIA
jgi:methenyltetrahydromethanopterin cyclohydrolase